MDLSGGIGESSAWALPEVVLALPPDFLPNVFRRQGEFWCVRFGGRAAFVKQARGMAYLARLLRHPGTELHVLDLLRLENAGAERRLAAAAHALGNRSSTDCGEHLDARARRLYQRRQLELRSELEEANRGGDLRRATAIREEIDFLRRELARAFGIGGRVRFAGSSSERARANVSRCLRDVVRIIAAQHPSLGDHLVRSLKTGTFCSYGRESQQVVEWVV